MNLFSIIMPPVIGGIIGAVTNDLAIKMLFRPYKAIYLWGRRLPFTPGIVPKNMDFLADALGREIVRRFFNADDLEILFQSDVFSDAVAGAVTDYFYSKKTTLCLTMEGMERCDDMGTVINNGKREICRYINEALAEYNFAPVINATVAEIADGRHGAAIPRTAKSSIKSVAPYISEALRDYLKHHGEKLIAPLMDNLLVEFADRPTKTIVESVFGDRESFKAIVKKAYLTFMATYVRDVVESIDVGGMISEKFRQMEPEAIEALILSIVKKELNYVVLLGGILGMVIGAVNILI